MNIIASLTARIEDYRATNKQPCKNYATEAAAEKATAAMAQAAADYFDMARLTGTRPARYVVFYNEAWGRWVGAQRSVIGQALNAASDDCALLIGERLAAPRPEHGA
jgi:hypothetical protein